MAVVVMAVVIVYEKSAGAVLVPINLFVRESMVITRDSIMELAQRELGLQVVERAIDRSELYLCDELFFTGTAVGVMPILQVDHRPVRNAEIGLITAQIRQLYFDATHGHMKAYRRWLAPVYKSQPQLEEAAIPA